MENDPRKFAVTHDPDSSFALVRAFYKELRRLVKHGNDAGDRIKTLQVIALYESGEVYVHRAGAFDDPMLLLGALRMAEDVTITDHTRIQHEIVGKLGITTPIERRSLEIGARFMSSISYQAYVENARKGAR